MTTGSATSSKQGGLLTPTLGIADNAGASCGVCRHQRLGLVGVALSVILARMRNRAGGAHADFKRTGLIHVKIQRVPPAYSNGRLKCCRERQISEGVSS